MQPTRGLSSPSLQKAFEKFRSANPGEYNTLYEPRYDYQTLPNAGISSLQFFQEPIGQSGKTLADTNMDLAGQLPKGQAFLITGVQVEVLPGVGIDDAAVTEFSDDVYAVTQGGVLILTIGSKQWVTQGNLMKFPPVNRLDGIAATGLAAQQIQYAQSSGREFQITDRLIESSQNFNVELRELAALPSGVDARIGVSLNGYLFRNAQ